MVRQRVRASDSAVGWPVVPPETAEFMLPELDLAAASLACDDYRVTVTKADDGAWLNAMGDPRPVNTYSRRAWGMLSGCRR